MRRATIHNLHMLSSSRRTAMVTSSTLRHSTGKATTTPTSTPTTARGSSPSAPTSVLTRPVLRPPHDSHQRLLSSLHNEHFDLENDGDVLDHEEFHREDAARADPSPSHLTYVSEEEMPITSTLRIVPPQEDMPRGTWPVFRVMDENGTLRSAINDGYKFETETLVEDDLFPYSIHGNDDHNGNPHSHLHKLRTDLSSNHPDHKSVLHHSSLFRPSPKTFQDIPTQSPRNLDPQHNTLLRCQRIIIRLRQMDDLLLNAQRQGRVSFYLTCRGEEGLMVGSASALKDRDVVLTQYREQGVLMWRGFTLEQFTNQCCGNDLDLGRGRQMPIHYGSRALNFVTISSCLGTQLPQAVGIAYKMKLDMISKKDHKPSVAAVYFGDGTSSTVDFHGACNFAATLKVPVLFICRNNGYAISTSSKDQFAGDGVVCRAKGYGMAAIRVDGNDVLAVHAATKAAREYALKHMEPVLLEMITYRQGHHSTSDDSTQYRPTEEVSNIAHNSDPIKRFNDFLIGCGWTSEDEIANIEKSERKDVLAALEKAEVRPGPKLDTLFQDVYYEMPSSLQRQERELHEHLKKYSDKYN